MNNNIIELLIIEIDEELKKSILNYSGYIPDNLYDGMLYSCFGGGKRIRPLLFLLSCQAFGLDRKEYLRIAASIELIHSYSLVHDDLPGMDNDLIRRGKASVHNKFGQGMAILIGDALLNCAYETLFQFSKDYNQYIAIASYISKKAGAIGMIGGQAKDIQGLIPQNIEQILEIYDGKTCALFEAAIVSPAICLNFPSVKFFKIERFSNIVGKIFQINDDFLDYHHKSEKINIIKIIGEDNTNILFNDLKKELYILAEQLNLNDSLMWKFIRKLLNI